MSRAAAALLVVALALPARAQERSLSVGVNAVKLAVGLPNLELEAGLLPGLSLALFSEVLLYRTPLTPPPGQHPDWVLRLGPRYYPYSFQPELDATGFLVGLAGGLAWAWQGPHPTPATLSLELGYKHVFLEHVYVLPRALLTHALNSRDLTPGLEILVGGSF